MELELSLDGGEKRIIKKGKILLQRASMQSWKNLSKTRGWECFLGSEGGDGRRDEVP